MNSGELRYLKECSYDLINTHCLFNKSKFDPKVSKTSSSPTLSVSRIIQGHSPRVAK